MQHAMHGRIEAIRSVHEFIFAREAHVPPRRVTVMRQLVRLLARRSDDECETHHMPIAALALLVRGAGGGLLGITAMSMRRMIYWWFRFVMSGRFLDRFLCQPNAPE
jgi:hypothetical protein